MLCLSDFIIPQFAYLYTEYDVIKCTKKPPTYVLVETVGIEPTSRDIATQTSTRIVDILSFAYRSACQQAYRQLV